VTLNGVAVNATLGAGMVTYPASPPPPPADAGPPDAGPPDAGTPDAGTPDAGTPDAGTSDAGNADAGTVDAGTPDSGPGDLCGNCVPAADGGPNPPLDAGTDNQQTTFLGIGCSHSGSTAGWMAALAALALAVSRRRQGT
jgi:MYXO-CTERM domain-containing protein